ncbi:unnamed protein product [Caenorhabditis sp. 36 PRJEB53466]|nr:unnamed protein product [Caenorhabditis sp. 36 PRJEB53466]
MRFLVVLSVVFVLFQLSAAHLGRLPAGCVYQQCSPHKGPSTCPQGTQTYKHSRCGFLWLQKQEICCPSLQTQPGAQVEIPAADYQG